LDGWGVGQNRHNNPLHQWQWIVGDGGVVLVDVLVRFESLKMGRLLKKNASLGAHPQNSRRIDGELRELFSEDNQRFGY
jgi:hypothetical protein